MIEIDDRLFLQSFDSFQRVLVPIINKEREAEELRPLTEQEEIDTFLDMRREWGIDKPEQANNSSL